MPDAPTICFLGGAFDPPHIAHLVAAECIREARGFDRIVFLPSQTPPLKDAPGASWLHRLAMLRLAIAGNPAFTIDECCAELPSGGATIEVLDHARGRDRGARVAFIVGADQIAALHRWRDAARLAREIEFIPVLRPPFDARVFEAAEANFRDVLGDTGARELARRLRAVVVAMPQMDISSSDIRRRIASGKSVRYLIPDAVRDYIERERLYR